MSLKFSETGQAQYFLEVQWWGLERLYAEVQELEKQKLQELLETGRAGVIAFSNFGSGPQDVIITNNFLWYSTSAVCFLGLLAHSVAKARTWKALFPAMLMWRHKVSAHSSFSWPQKDNTLTQDASIMMHPGWHFDRYWVGGFVFSDGERVSSAEWRWSLTETHGRIKQFVEESLKRDA